MTPRPILYDELAEWWPLVDDPSAYADEAAVYATILREHSSRPPGSLLELGSGGGNNASHLKHVFGEMTLVDRAPAMLAVSRRLNPECEHVEGDMRSVRLERLFDCVFVHDALCHVTTREDLAAVVETAFAHCAPGGAALFAPDHVAETFRECTGSGGEDGDGRALRYLEWTRDPDPEDETYLVDYAYLLKHEDGRVEVRHEQFLEGLFSTAVWRETLAAAGFVPQVLTHRHDGVPHDSIVVVGKKSMAEESDS